jgi:ABC-type multidrug transport system fused ATPase/permease subunit
VQQAGLHEWVADLPQGYDLPLGESGMRLSRGQAQMVALARAFLKRASLVALDEPTANMDPETQERVSAALYRLLEGRTGLVIAHRLPTAARASKILVLQNGSILASGSHHELLETYRLYQQMASAYHAELGEDST